jgi:hypothetical protein
MLFRQLPILYVCSDVYLTIGAVLCTLVLCKKAFYQCSI